LGLDDAGNGEKHGGYLIPFLDYCEVQKGLADNTQRNYRNYLRVFFDWLKKKGHEGLAPDQLSAEHIWDYRLYLARSHKSPTDRYLSKRSQNGYLIAIRAFLEFLAERDIDTLPSSKVKLAKQKGQAAAHDLHLPSRSALNPRVPRPAPGR
jgi:site-specific recombinase XerD